jgi:twitching motility protein PilT
MYSAIQTGQAYGMQTLDQCMQDMLRRGQITKQDARSRAVNKELFG